MSFLIADDSPAKMFLLKALLTKAKWKGKIVTATTTEEAIDMIEEHAISHAFIDYYIPSRNGPAIITHLKEKNPKARMALVSSSDKEENKNEALGAGAEAFICTTWEDERVEREVLELLNTWSMKQKV